MPATYTQTSTSTSTYVRHIVGKLAADLKRIQRLTGNNVPTDERIAEFQQEAVILLKHGCLGEVTYGFKRNEKWVYAIKYCVINGEFSGNGDDPGGIRPFTVDGAFFTSFLTYSSQWHSLSLYEQQEIEKTLPVRRTPGYEPEVENGYWSDDRRYLAGSLGFQRTMIQRY